MLPAMTSSGIRGMGGPGIRGIVLLVFIFEFSVSCDRTRARSGLKI